MANIKNRQVQSPNLSAASNTLPVRERIKAFLDSLLTTKDRPASINFVGRFNRLPRSAPGQLLMSSSVLRQAGRIKNFGYGTAFISNDRNVSENDYPLDPGQEIPDVISWSQNIYAIGETADLRVWEISQ